MTLQVSVGGMNQSINQDNQPIASMPTDAQSMEQLSTAFNGGPPPPTPGWTPEIWHPFRRALWCCGVSHPSTAAILEEHAENVNVDKLELENHVDCLTMSLVPSFCVYTPLKIKILKLQNHLQLKSGTSSKNPCTSMTCFFIRGSRDPGF